MKKTQKKTNQKAKQTKRNCRPVSFLFFAACIIWEKKDKLARGGRLAAACGKCKQAVSGRNIFSFAIRSIRSLPRRNYKKSNIKKKQQKTWNCSWLSEVQARRGAGQGAAAGEVVLHCSSSKNRKGSERVSYQDFDFDIDLQQQRETGFNWRLPVVVRFVLKESLPLSPPAPCRPNLSWWLLLGSTSPWSSHSPLARYEIRVFPLCSACSASTSASSSSDSSTPSAVRRRSSLDSAGETRRCKTKRKTKRNETKRNERNATKRGEARDKGEYETNSWRQRREWAWCGENRNDMGSAAVEDSCTERNLRVRSEL